MKQYASQPLYLAMITFVLLTTLTACGGSDSNTASDDTTDIISPPDSSTPVPDTSIDEVIFTPLNDIPLSTLASSNLVTISGIDTEIDISIDKGEFSINGADYTSTSSKINNGDTVSVQLMSAEHIATETIATISLGTFNTRFVITTINKLAVENTQLSFNLDTVHSVNGVDSFTREKFITVHASHTENDWYSVGTNESEDLITEFVEGYDVYFGRDTGGMHYQLSLLPESSINAGYVDAEIATNNGGNSRWIYTTGTDKTAEKKRQHEHRNANMVVAAQQHPYWPDGKDTGQGWAFSQLDTTEEPFGTATGDYMGQFIAKYFNKNDGVDIYGQPKPKYIEVMNEPLYELVDIADDPASVNQVFQFHSNVAKAIKTVTVDGVYTNDNVLIGGYTVAFPDFDKQNFQRWETRDKAFIDVAGNDMDFISLHFYDFPAFQDRTELRTGSNIEASFDMLEHYMHLSLGDIKPFLVSEFGAQTHSLFNQPWLAYRDWFHLKAINGQLMSFLERPDQIEMAIPFVPIKAEWGRLSDTVPYYTRLMRQKFEKTGETGDEYVYTDMVKFYQLWSEVKGTRVDSFSTDLDMQLNAFVDGSNAYLIINSLEHMPTTVDITLLGLGDNTPSEILVKQLYLDEQTPMLSETNVSDIAFIDSLEIAAEATVIIKLSYDNDIELNHTQIETKYYADKYKQPITANNTLNFSINDVVIAENGEAVLRLGLGREHGKSLTPNVMINSQPVEVTADYRGYDQYHKGEGRLQFFGVIELSISNQFIQTDNTIELTFDDDGGFVTSLSMQYFQHSKQLTRNNQ
ncbi:hypothetical protein L2735_02285 [Shewanella olleyana]|uniref:hypothetical protein n=1 Tax=Shewanella olleyana TaxID=135626 RepID=UPI00200C0DBC|nr:hypothetical protein [Shewanella olleyana]MCL1065639.1 hypothetical protein [Shewanella olleyana]